MKWLNLKKYITLNASKMEWIWHYLYNTIWSHSLRAGCVHVQCLLLWTEYRNVNREFIGGFTLPHTLRAKGIVLRLTEGKVCSKVSFYLFYNEINTIQAFLCHVNSDRSKITLTRHDRLSRFGPDSLKHQNCARALSVILSPEIFVVNRFPATFFWSKGKVSFTHVRSFVCFGFLLY